MFLLDALCGRSRYCARTHSMSKNVAGWESSEMHVLSGESARMEDSSLSTSSSSSRFRLTPNALNAPSRFGSVALGAGGLADARVRDGRGKGGWVSGVLDQRLEHLRRKQIIVKSIAKIGLGPSHKPLGREKRSGRPPSIVVRLLVGSRIAPEMVETHRWSASPARPFKTFMCPPRRLRMARMSSSRDSLESSLMAKSQWIGAPQIL